MELNITPEKREQIAKLLDEMRCGLDPGYQADQTRWPYTKPERRKPMEKYHPEKNYTDDGEEILTELPEAEDGSYIEMTYDETNNRVYIRHFGKRKQEVVLDREEWAKLRAIEIKDPDE